MTGRALKPGIDVLLSRHRSWLTGRRVGLVGHQAAVDQWGCAAAERLWRDPDVELTCLLGPEHGFFGRAGAGVACAHARHASWRIPIYSLYGARRRPTPAMLRRVDALVVDLQDLAVRCYTYVSTLKLVLEAAAEADKEVIVADRPVPLPRTVDGPVTAPGAESFVAAVETPLCYGMTPGETALWIRDRYAPAARVRVAPMSGYHRAAAPPPGAPPWVPPSPGIATWEAAACYPATVCFEALGAVDHGRRTRLPFQVFGARWMHGADMAEALTDAGLPGVAFYAHPYDARPYDRDPAPLDGVRMVLTRPHAFRPARTAVTIVATLQRLYGKRRVWNVRTSRPGFFDQLFGTPAVREALLDGEAPDAIVARWRSGLSRFRRQREKVLLYS